MALGGDDGDQRFGEMPAARRRVGLAVRTRRIIADVVAREALDARDIIGDDRVRDEGDAARYLRVAGERRSEEHTSELQSLMRISYAVFCLNKKNKAGTLHRRRPQRSARLC